MKTEKSFLLECCTIIKSYHFRTPIEWRSVLSTADVEVIKKLKLLRVRGREAEWNARRVKVIDCLLQNGASAVFFEILATYETRLLEDLMSFLPKNILKNWIERAKTLEGEAGNLVYFAQERGWGLLMNLMLCYGANYQTRSDKGNELRWNFQLLSIHKLFLAAEKGLEIDLRSMCIDRFLAKIRARNSQGFTILQVSLKNGHVNTLEQIVNSVIRNMPKYFVLESSEMMTYDELLEGSELYLKQVKTKLVELENHQEEEDCIFFECIVEIFESANKILKLWEKYESGMDRFFGEPNVTIVEETLELLQLLKFVDHTRSLAKDRTTRFLGNWQQIEKEFAIKVAKIILVAPIEAFIKAIFGAKLYEAVKLDDEVAATKCIAAGANLNLIDRNTAMSLVQLAVDLRNERVAKVLLNNQADVGKACKLGLFKTLLHIAVEKRSLIIVDAILKNYRDEVEIHNYIDNVAIGSGKALYLAAKLGQIDMVKCILRYQATYRLKAYKKCGYSLINGVEAKKCRDFLYLIDNLFVGVSKGDATCLEIIKSLPADELLAACNACDDDGYNLAQIARINKHDFMAEEIFHLVKLASIEENIAKNTKM